MVSKFFLISHDNLDAIIIGPSKSSHPPSPNRNTVQEGTAQAVSYHTTPGLPRETLNEIPDCLTLALDVSEKPNGYTQQERGTRAYLRAARRYAASLIGGAA